MAAGEAAALETVYDRYSGVIHSLALRILGDRGAAEEVVQDVFVRIWRLAGRYDARQGRLYSWLVRIARNRAIDEQRRLRVPGRVAPRRGGRDPSFDREDPAMLPAEPDGDGLTAAELRQVVGNALGEIPEDQRSVLEMAYYEGLSQREISEKTSVPLGTVKTRTRLALRKLREALDPTLKERVEGGADGLR
jgi:RNA polymerase sigma-70 factor (ECF subfamily)